MNTEQFVLVIGSLAAATASFIWMARNRHEKPAIKSTDILHDVERDVEHIFNDEFRDGLRNSGRLHFEKIIGDNAMFLQQDLRLTTSQLNEYMKEEITKKLKEEFDKYEQSIVDAKEMAVDSITKTQKVIEEQRQQMSQQLTEEIAKEKARLIANFEENMADIINHYVLSAIGDQIDLNDQIEYILSDLEANKQAIVKDITDGA